MPSWWICVLVAFVTDHAPQDLTDADALLINEECRRRGGEDQVCPFTVRIEEMRRLPRPRGPRGLVFELIRRLMIALLQLVVSVVEQRRARACRRGGGGRG